MLLLFVLYFHAINLFLPSFPFLYPGKRQKTFGFLTFSRSIDMEDCAKTGFREDNNHLYHKALL